jgi:CO/xanthine dehydrogenase FAD-binding subunit
MDVLRPSSLGEALALKAKRPEAAPIAGGTDLMVEWQAGRPRPAAVLDLSRLPELRQCGAEDGVYFLGAGVTYASILREPMDRELLAQASRTVGSPQIRARGTVGGNLGTASPAGDTLPVLAAHDAEVLLRSESGSRWLPWDAFLVGPKRTALRPDELIVGVRWPLRRRVGSFSKVGTRTATVVAVASLAMAIDEDAREVRIALGSVGPTVLRAREAEAFACSMLEGAGTWDDPDVPVQSGAAAELGALVAAAAHPIDDVRGTAAYRRHACAILGARAFGWLLAQRSTLAQAA